MHREKHFRKASLLKRMRQTVNLSSSASPTAGKVSHFRFPPSVFSALICHHRKLLTDGPDSHSHAGNCDNQLSLCRNSSHRQASLPSSVCSLTQPSTSIIVAALFQFSFKQNFKNHQCHDLMHSALFNNASGSCLCQRAGNGLFFFLRKKPQTLEKVKVSIKSRPVLYPSCPMPCSQEQCGHGEAAVRYPSADDTQ